jgi:hypothetical protein
MSPTLRKVTNIDRETLVRGRHVEPIELGDFEYLARAHGSKEVRTAWTNFDWTDGVRFLALHEFDHDRLVDLVDSAE